MRYTDSVFDSFLCKIPNRYNCMFANKSAKIHKIEFLNKTDSFCFDTWCIVFVFLAPEGGTMKYLGQFCVIMIFVFLGELMEHFIPLPIAGSIYGLLLLFFALVLGVVKLSWVEDVADWLHGIMALFFVAPAVAIIDIWGDISDIWWMLVILLVVTYLVSMLTTAVTAEALIAPHRRKGKGGEQ